MWRRLFTATLITILLDLGSALPARAEPIPHGQSRPPGDPLSPAEAVNAMTLPEGFTVELVASEPDLVNPVAMTFDDQGRIWVAESLEYPRREAGPGRDRIKILEDTNGDGKADRFTVFAEGLNIPSGIAFGHGGVWVANAPDLLLLKDTDGDGKADQREVIVTGFGRDDTHELPNSLSWGPDGWLYGWNGVFNRSHINYRGKIHDFTCAIFRVHPRTRAFELFCEGTSNPWGLAWDRNGSAFASACVIDHLWHLTETGYYHRQGGPYPPFTWQIGSIVSHRHQQAAYCGLLYYDSDAYPERYRGKLFMGNIHGGALNVDRLRRKGSTYLADAEPDFLNAHDAWFMPVSLKAGPDGCLYVLDWYDRYHCYQDANRDPAGIDRLKGRLYRIRYQGTPRRSRFDLAREPDSTLIDRLGSANAYDRETARRLLAERENAATDQRLETLAIDPKSPEVPRMNALWTRISRSTANLDFLKTLMADANPTIRAWGVRASGNLRKDDPKLKAIIRALATDRSRDVQLQVAIASRKIEGMDAVGLLTEVASACGDDPLIPQIVWQNLHPMLDSSENAQVFLDFLTIDRLRKAPALLEIAPRAIDRIVSGRNAEKVPIVLFVLRLAEVDTGSAREALRDLSARVQNGEFRDSTKGDALREQIKKPLQTILDDAQDDPIRVDMVLLATSLKLKEAYPAARSYFVSKTMDEADRVGALRALIAARDATVLAGVRRIFGDQGSTSSGFRGQVISALSLLDEPGVAALFIENYPRLEPELRPRAVELLAERGLWHAPLVQAVLEKTIPSGDLNVNQIRKLLASKDASVVAKSRSIWGSVRSDRKPEREKAIARVRSLLSKVPGDPAAGAEVFKKICAQCHKIYGEGQEVGPEITANGRNSYEQLLSNVFDPSLVIGAAYQATTVATNDGRVLTGLLVEQSPERVVLKLQGGKTETVPRDQVEALKVSSLSLMPEDLDAQLNPRDLADLFAYICLDRPPTDPKARPIPGAQELKRRSAR